jgi:hypothetical protein
MRCNTTGSFLQAQPQPGDTVPIVCDNRLPRGPILGPEQPRSPDRAFAPGGFHSGGLPWHQRS